MKIGTWLPLEPAEEGPWSQVSRDFLAAGLYPGSFWMGFLKSWGAVLALAR